MKIKINFFTISAIVIVVIVLAIVLFIKFRPTPNDTYCINSITQEKVIFIFSPECHFCQSMEPFMEKRNDTYWLNVQSKKCTQILENLNLNIQYIPTFVCTKNISIFISGARSEQDINSWIEENC
jgi:hypothetical protein